MSSWGTSNLGQVGHGVETRQGLRYPIPLVLGVCKFLVALGRPLASPLLCLTRLPVALVNAESSESSTRPAHSQSSYGFIVLLSP